MMKVFDKNEDEFWGQKVNFVDENNVVLGYDMDSHCFELYGWYLLDKVSENISDEENCMADGFNWDHWVFDKNFFVWIDLDDRHEDGGIAVFKIRNKINQEMYIHLYNSHNGYYSHGFKLSENGQTIEEGSI
ncbi:MAG: hypothetical protein JSV32_00415 [Dehalococcoidia bacterium]|nr:MAG: hypothetical protein JSV32_00415 [Dehalococcoidia bacterium]